MQTNQLRTLASTALYGDFFCAVGLFMATLLYAASIAYASSGTGLDMDGWGYLVTRVKIQNGAMGALFSEPSLWKGPLVPFVFGLTYAAWPHDKTILYANAALWATTQAMLFLTYRAFDVPRMLVLSALCAWIIYLPNRIIFEFYFAEPVIAFLSTALLIFTLQAVNRRSPFWAGASGVAASLVLLARAPFAFVIAGIIPLLWFHGGSRRTTMAGAYILCAALTFAPWPIRNYLATGALIPFTTEGGMIVAQGTFLPGHGENLGVLRTIPEWTAMERATRGMSAVEHYRYWQRIARNQIRAAPVAQLQLVTRKFMLFWMYLYPHTWIPTIKTALVAGISLVLGIIGFVSNRREPLIQLTGLWIGGLWVFHAIVHAELRYNFPVVPLLFLLAAIGCSSMASKLRRRFDARQPLKALATSGGAL